jgi:hypothetical protein
VSQPSRRFCCIRRIMGVDDGHLYRWEYFDEGRGIWWPDAPTDATHYASASRANATCSEHMLLEEGKGVELIWFRETAPPVTGAEDDSDGEWWKHLD